MYLLFFLPFSFATGSVTTKSASSQLSRTLDARQSQRGGHINAFEALPHQQGLGHASAGQQKQHHLGAVSCMHSLTCEGRGSPSCEGLNLNSGTFGDASKRQSTSKSREVGGAQGGRIERKLFQNAVFLGRSQDNQMRLNLHILLFPPVFHTSTSTS